MENGNEKFPFVCCKQKRKPAFVFLGRQTINDIDIGVAANVPNYVNIHVRDGARFKYKLMGVMVYF